MKNQPLTKLQLRPEFRKMLREQSLLRYKIASDLMLNERTINRWAQANNPSLTDDSFLKSLKKHTKATAELTEEVVISEPHLINE